MSRIPTIQEFLSKLPAGLFVSIRIRVILSYLVIVGIGLLFLVKQMTDIRPQYSEAQEETMVDLANVLAAIVEQSFDADRINPATLRAALNSMGDRKFTARIYKIVKSSVDLRIYATDATGRVIFDSDHGKAEGKDYSQWNDVYLTLRGEYGTRSTRTDESDPTTSTLFVAAPIRHHGKIAGALSVGKPVTSMAAFMAHSRTHILLLGGGAAGLVVLIGVLFSAWITYPIRNLTGYAKAIRDGRRTPLPNLGHSEMRTLGLAFEEMRDAIEGKDYVNRYVQTLTHEMKSPLAAIQGASELLQEEMPTEERRKFLENIRNETVRIQEAVDSLLLLASVESKKSLDHVVPVDLAAVIRSAVDRISARAHVKAVALVPNLSPEIEQNAEVSGDLFLLERTVVNLLENAVAFTPAGGSVAIGLERDQEGWVLTVDDDGPGIPDYALSRVFERFYSLPRPDTGKKSSGLGLAFAREVALLHGGGLTLGNRQEGGARAALRLPA